MGTFLKQVSILAKSMGPPQPPPNISAAALHVSGSVEEAATVLNSFKKKTLDAIKLNDLKIEKQKMEKRIRDEQRQKRLLEYENSRLDEKRKMEKDLRRTRHKEEREKANYRYKKDKERRHNKEEKRESYRRKKNKERKTRKEEEEEETYRRKRDEERKTRKEEEEKERNRRNRHKERKTRKEEEEKERYRRKRGEERRQAEQDKRTERGSRTPPTSQQEGTPKTPPRIIDSENNDHTGFEGPIDYTGRGSSCDFPN
ncbi:unnamed protein product [Bemisia tabaci]|uniref:Uncharacterized protein n=1 Tax=Bemisia tabaci TaxID=7038 RepID=A0A9P0AM21_BEMTA|nr:unnamed protein product [Bemisia tabaci]